MKNLNLTPITHSRTEVRIKIAYESSVTILPGNKKSVKKHKFTTVESINLT